MTLRRQILEELEAGDAIKAVHPSMSLCVCVCAHMCRDGVSGAAQPPFEPPTAIHEQVNDDGSQENRDPHQQPHDDDPLVVRFWRRQKP